VAETPAWQDMNLGTEELLFGVLRNSPDMAIELFKRYGKKGIGM
jgi:hypothetical protein